MTVHRSVNRLIEIVPTLNPDTVGRVTCERFWNVMYSLRSGAKLSAKQREAFQPCLDHGSEYVRELARDVLAAFQMFEDNADG